MKKSNKNTTKNNKTNKKSPSYVRIATGIYKTTTGKYAVRPTIDGVRKYVTFTSLKAANTYRKSTINS
jgi:hypothetical protein